jgi:hypothetical protein
MNVIVAVACVALAALLTLRAVMFLRSRRQRREGLELIPGGRQDGDPDFGLEVAQVCLSLGQGVYVTEREEGVWKAVTDDGREATGSDPGDAARKLLN